MTRVTIKPDEQGIQRYDVRMYRNLQYGYRNPLIAMDFGKTVADMIRKRTSSPVHISACDGSSMVLASTVGMHLEHCQLTCTSPKYRVPYQGTPYYVFVDDYRATGQTLKLCVEALGHPVDLAVYIDGVINSQGDDHAKELIIIQRGQVRRAT